jgi:hypothetical protein
MSVTIPTRSVQQSPASNSPVVGADAEALREAAIASLKRKRKFVRNAVAYVTVNGVLWLIWALTGRPLDGNMPWPAWVTAIWGFFLAMDAWRIFGGWPQSGDRPITEDDIEREIKRSRPS